MDVACKLCESVDTIFIERIDRKPVVEVDYGIPAEQYKRSIYKCKNCGVFFNEHQLLQMDTFYSGSYNSSIDEKGLLGRFNKITSLPQTASDNYQRVSRIIDYWNTIKKNLSKTIALDIGSGTCVFLNELKKHIYQTYCIDPDLSAVQHAKNIGGVTGAHHGNIFNYSPQIEFDLIAFNKVLEHVEDPVGNLKAAGKHLKEDGRIYIELPESDRIVKAGMINERAEFALEHLTIFNTRSLEYLSNSARFILDESGIITDPSGKFTIYGFLRK